MWYKMTKDEVIKKLNTSIQTGLSDFEVERRIKEVGQNKLAEAKKPSLFIKFIKQFNNFMIIILIFAAIISAIISYIQKTNEYIDSIIIIVIVILNSIMGVIQESKAEKALEALKKLSAPNAKVKRNGQVRIIPCEKIVPGDYIILETGAFVPADARLISAYNLKVEESALTRRNCSCIKRRKHSI